MSEDNEDRLGRKGGPEAAGPGDYCVCPDCGHRVPHDRALPCYQRECPRCGRRMTREVDKKPPKEE